MKYQPFLPIAVLTVLLAAGFASAAEYTCEQIAVLEYGSGEGQLGLIQEEGMLAGPDSFYVSKNGKIYICDSVNQAVKKLSPSGKLLESKKIGFYGNDIAADENGDLFILDRSRMTVEQINAKGKKQKQISLDRSMVDEAFSLRIRGGELVLATVRQQEIVLGQKKQSQLKLADAPLQFKNGFTCNGRRVRTQRNEKGEAEIDLFNEKGEAEDLLMLPVENVASVIFLGQDKAGYSYYQVETSEAEAGVTLNVYCLDADGYLDSTIEHIPNCYFTWTAKLLQVDDKGDIYQVLPTEENVQVNVWRRQKSGNENGNSSRNQK